MEPCFIPQWDRPPRAMPLSLSSPIVPRIALKGAEMRREKNLVSPPSTQGLPSAGSGVAETHTSFKVFSSQSHTAAVLSDLV